MKNKCFKGLFVFFVFSVFSVFSDTARSQEQTLSAAGDPVFDAYAFDGLHPSCDQALWFSVAQTEPQNLSSAFYKDARRLEILKLHQMATLTEGFVDFTDSMAQKTRMLLDVGQGNSSDLLKLEVRQGKAKMDNACVQWALEDAQSDFTEHYGDLAGQDLTDAGRLLERLPKSADATFSNTQNRTWKTLQRAQKLKAWQDQRVQILKKMRNADQSRFEMGVLTLEARMLSEHTLHHARISQTHIQHAVLLSALYFLNLENT